MNHLLSDVFVTTTCNPLSESSGHVKRLMARWVALHFEGAMRRFESVLAFTFYACVSAALKEPRNQDVKLNLSKPSPDAR